MCLQPLKLDFQAFDIKLRMTVARLPDGSLLLVSPLAPTDELLRLLGSLGGAVRHIVLPSSAPEHWFFGPQLSERFPDATVWTVPGLLEGKGLPIPFFGSIVAGMRPRCKTLGERAACLCRPGRWRAGGGSVRCSPATRTGCSAALPTPCVQAWTRCRQSCRARLRRM